MRIVIATNLRCIRNYAVTTGSRKAQPGSRPGKVARDGVESHSYGRAAREQQVKACHEKSSTFPGFLSFELARPCCIVWRAARLLRLHAAP